MKILLMSGADSYPALLGDIEEAFISTDYESARVVLLCSNGRSNEFQPRGFTPEEAKGHCILLIEYIAQELMHGTPLIEIDEEAGFERTEYGIISLMSFPFPDAPENVEEDF